MIATGNPYETCATIGRSLGCGQGKGQRTVTHGRLGIPRTLLIAIRDFLSFLSLCWVSTGLQRIIYYYTCASDGC